MVLLVPKREGAQGEKERNLGALRRYGEKALNSINWILAGR